MIHFLEDEHESDFRTNSEKFIVKKKNSESIRKIKPPFDFKKSRVAPQMLEVNLIYHTAHTLLLLYHLVKVIEKFICITDSCPHKTQVNVHWNVRLVNGSLFQLSHAIHRFVCLSCSSISKTKR